MPTYRDYRDDDEPPAPRRRPARDADRRPRPDLIASAIMALAPVAWVVLFLMVAGGGALFLALLAQARSAVQEAAVAAEYAAAVVGLYVLARCVEKVTAAFRRDDRR